MSDDAYRGTVDPLGPHRRRFGRRDSRKNFALGFGGIAGGLASSLVFGPYGPVPALLLGGTTIVVGELIHRRRASRSRVDLHAGGLRIQIDGEATVPWDAIAELRFGYTPEQRPSERRGGLTLVHVDGRRFELPLHFDGHDELVAAIEDATTPAQIAALETRLDRGGVIGWGRHLLGASGIRTKLRDLPWSALGPVRRHHGCLMLDSEIGPFELPIDAIANPAAIAAVVAARGRRRVTASRA